MLVQPAKRGSAHLLHTGCGHHDVVGLKQRLHNHTEDPEFPVLEGLGSDIFLKPLPHVIKALAGDGDASGRELLLTHIDGGVEC